MKKILLIVSLLFATLGFSQAKGLFNGEDLKGWIIYGTEKWYVEDGLLVCESGPDEKYGYLATDKHYKDFELTLEFKQEADGNSGVFIRSTIDGTKVSGWQIEVAPPGHGTGGVYESYGRGWLIKPDTKKDDVLKEGEWNKMKIRVYGGTITSWLNGTEMITITDDKIGAGEGSIALQIHDGGGIKVKWRNIKIVLPQ
ncbi:MAG: secreted glycosyl hydrolase [Maribacter sp.]|nr:MAG: secreted glycosyl hydrolase [Maribacter sp.]